MADVEKGDPVNPPDKPGVKVVTLQGSDDDAASQLEPLLDDGYKLVGFDGNRAILVRGY